MTGDLSMTGTFSGIHFQWTHAISQHGCVGSLDVRLPHCAHSTQTNFHDERCPLIDLICDSFCLVDTLLPINRSLMT